MKMYDLALTQIQNRWENAAESISSQKELEEFTGTEQFRQEILDILNGGRIVDIGESLQMLKNSPGWN